MTNRFNFFKSQSIFLVLLLSVHASVKPVVGEMMLGAMGMAAVKAATSPTGRAARWAATGYLLNTAPGKKFTAFGFGKMRQIVSNRFFPAQLGTGASMTTSAALVQASRNALRNCGQSSVQLFRSLPRSMAEFRARVAAISLRNPFSKVTEFSTQASSTSSFASGPSKARASFTGFQNKMSSAFTYRKAQPQQSTSFNAQKNYTAHQATAMGLFPRVNYYQGHYHGDQGYWKGFATGSFASWTTAAALYLGIQKKEQQNLRNQKIEQPKSA